MKQLKQWFPAFFLVFLSLCISPFANAADKLKVVTATSDLASITQMIGGDKVDVFSIGQGYQNPHFIPPKPSYILKLKDADLLVSVGMELDIWLNQLIENSRNAKIYRNGPGYVDASLEIPVIGAPASKIDRSLGDIHPYGNPHYWLDPVNAKYISANIVNGLKRVDPKDGAYFDQQRQAFLKQLAGKLTGWINKAKPLRGVKVITYHESWPYFEKRFGLDAIGYIEPKPGIPPTAKHTQQLIQQGKDEHVKLIIMEPYYNRAVPDQIANAIGAKVVTLPPSVGGAPGANDYFSLFDTIINTLLKNL